MSEDDLLKIVRAQEDKIRPQRFESAFFWDRQGNLLLRKDGEPTSVRFSAAEITLVKGAIATHNHPLGWNYSASDPRRAGNSFSENDARSACYLSLSILRIVTPKFRYMMRPPLSGWDGDYWEKILGSQFQQLYAQAWDEFKAKVQARQMLSSVAGTTFQHEVWCRVAAVSGVRYEREEF